MKNQLIVFFTIMFIAHISKPVLKLSVDNKQEVLDIAKQFLPENPIILDAGAFDGTDTVAMAKMWPNSTLYAFEPVPQIYGWLTNNTKSCSNIYCFSVALSNKVGVQKFFLSEDPNNPGINSQSGSLLAPKEHLNYSHIEFKNETIVPIITIDRWAQENNVSRIDMMWLDLQGMELDVLKASPDILSTVRVIYTEVEFVEAYAGQGMYEDIRAFLLAQGFVEYAKNFEAPGNGGWGWFGDVMFVRADIYNK
jgi:FkbM family methyltransferase